MEKYFVVRQDTRQVLNQSGGWAKNFSSPRLAEHETEADALAAIPSGMSCTVIQRPSIRPQQGTEFCLVMSSKALTLLDTFSAKNKTASDVQIFPSEEAALDKAASLGLDLDRVFVVQLS